MSSVAASAPGKALLCGEYAVLEGAPAVVAAVSRRVSVTWSEKTRPMAPEVAATLAAARKECGPLPTSLEIDTSALRHGEAKLGLGSSAAAAAATAGAAFSWHGHDLDDPECLERVFATALRGHSAVAPQGSGADVAASTFGGFLRFVRSGSEIEKRPLRRPEALVIRLVWTGSAARTSDLVDRVQRLRDRDPPGYRGHVERVSGLATAFADAFENGRRDEVIRHAGSYAEAMSALGDAAGAPIVEGRLRRIGALAGRFSGSAKPSGAGGGDVAVAFFADEDAAQSFERACEDEGLQPIDVAWGAAGVLAR